MRLTAAAADDDDDDAKTLTKESTYICGYCLDFACNHTFALKLGLRKLTIN